MRPLCLILISLFSFPIFANDSSYGGDGAAVYSIDNPHVQMLEEDIHIRALPQERNGRFWQAVCEFRFKNLTDSVLDVQMGFPDWKMHSESSHDSYAISGFTAEIQGKRIPTKHKQIKARPVTSSVGEDFPAAYIWKVPFQPQEELSVKNTYDFNGFTTLTAVNDLLRAKEQYQKWTPLFFWSVPTPKEVDSVLAFEAAGHSKGRKRKQFSPYAVMKTEGAKPWVYGNSIYSLVRYIVTTGKTWKMPIRRARIRFTLPATYLAHQVVIHPNGYHFVNNEITWSIEDFVPGANMEIVMIRPFPPETPGIPVFNSLKEAKAWTRIAKKNGSYSEADIRRLWQAYYFNTKQKLPAQFVDEKEFLKGIARSFQVEEKDLIHRTLTSEEKQIITWLQKF